MSEPLNVLSLGAGVQSTTVLLMAAAGELPRLDAAIFADTGWEPKAVYEHLNWLERVTTIPIHRVSHGNIRDDILNRTEHRADNSTSRSKRFVPIPVFMKREDGRSGIGRRECTREYKVYPVRRKVRELVGPGGTARLWMGISLDEFQRMRDSEVKYIEHFYPLVEARLTRNDCLLWMERHGLPRPPKSACIGCPFHTDAGWRNIRERPDEWAEAVAIDEVVRHIDSIKTEGYLHSSLVPLADAPIDGPEDKGQLPLWDGTEECQGYCGL